MMKTAKFNLWPLALVVWALVFYLGVTDTSWLFYLALSFVFLERLSVAVSIWITQKMAAQMAARIMNEFAQSQQEPPTDSSSMIGGRPE